jgi:hypothetical protein
MGNQYTIDTIDFNIPKLEIKEYYTITINDYFLTENINLARINYTDIPNYLTKDISKVSTFVLFNSRETAEDQLRQLVSEHYLVRHNDKVSIAMIRKAEVKRPY